MLDMDEVLFEQAKAKARAAKDDQISLLNRMPSFNVTISKTRALTKNPSFFKKMFSMRNMDKVFADDDDSQDGSQLSQDNGDGDQQSPSAAQETKDHGDVEDDADSNNSDDGDEGHGNQKKNKRGPSEQIVELDSKYAYVDPPLPKIGQPVDMDKLINRNKKAEYGLQALMELVRRDVDEALHDVKQIPVASTFDRIAVTEEQSAYIARARTTTDLEKNVQRNMNHIQKALNYRKSALIMMNSNYSHQLVRMIEPIYVNEARTIVKRPGENTGHKGTRAAREAAEAAAAGAATES